MATDNPEKLHKEWEDVWSREGLLPQIVSGGRGVYNYFFRHFFRRYTRSDARLLELGCGTSTLILSLAPGFAEVVGLDISEEALKISRKNADKLGVKNATFLRGDCLDLQYENEFDIVWSQGLMEHFEHPELVAREHYKAAKKGGVALISVPYKYSYHTLWYKMTRPKILRSLWPWTDQIFLDKKELLRIGQMHTPRAQVHILQPFFLGIAILELPR